MASTTPVRRPWTDRLKARWPTALALALSAATFGGTESAEGVASLSEVLLLLPLLYLVVAKLRRRQASWPVLVVGITPFVALRAVDVIEPAAVFSAVALVVLSGAPSMGSCAGPTRSGSRRWECLGSARSRWPGS
jgi:hypothetical protein